MQKWSSDRSLLATVLAYAFINELDDRKESMVIKFSDGIRLRDIVSRRTGFEFKMIWKNCITCLGWERGS